MQRSGSVENPDATPFDEVPPVVLPPLPAVEPAATIPVQTEFTPLRLYTDLETWRYTSNCQGCMQMRQGHEAAGVPHTAACRNRIERAIVDVGDQQRSASQNSSRNRLLTVIPARTQLSALERATSANLRSRRVVPRRQK